ncbi:MAG: hypothetical protein ACYSTS_18105 [Planctomycetota bacterium]|jgi:hypothetical protein
MDQNVPSELQNTINESVLRYVRDASAHSDISEALSQATAPLGDVQTFCPNASQYRYVFVSTRQIIFGFAIGMDSISFRLDPIIKARALVSGGNDITAIGPEWVSFILFRDDWPEVDVAFWARKAYVFARETHIV